MPIIYDADVPPDGNCLYSAVLVALINGVVTGEINEDSATANALTGLICQMSDDVRTKFGADIFNTKSQTLQEQCRALMILPVDPYVLLEEIMVPQLRAAIADYALNLEETDEARLALKAAILLVQANSNVKDEEVESLVRTYTPRELSSEEFTAHFEEVRDHERKRAYGSVSENVAMEKMYGVKIESFKTNSEVATPSDNKVPTLYIRNVGEHYHVGLPPVSQQDVGDPHQQEIIQFCKNAVVSRRAKNTKPADFDVRAFNDLVIAANKSFNRNKSAENVNVQIAKIETALPKEVFQQLSTEKKAAASKSLQQLLGALEYHFKNSSADISKKQAAIVVSYDLQKIVPASSTSVTTQAVVGKAPSTPVKNHLHTKSSIPVTAIANPQEAKQQTLLSKLRGSNGGELLHQEITTQIAIYKASSDSLKQAKGNYLQTILDAMAAPENSQSTFSKVVDNVTNQITKSGGKRWGKEVYTTGFQSSVTETLASNLRGSDRLLTSNTSTMFQSHGGGASLAAGMIKPPGR